MALALGACATSASNSSANSASHIVSVVAAENFYGNIAQQIGGKYVNVTNILSDPNVDPHEYESNFSNVKATATADLVIQNGSGYDSWMNKLLANSLNKNRIVLTGYDIAKVHIPDNEHVWYNVDNAQTIAGSITAALTKLDPTHAATFKSNLQSFNTSLNQIRTKMNEIKNKYNGTPVALTETIFQYQAEPMGLAIQTPEAFQKAIAEGNDPPANAVITAQQQITSKHIKVLIYNQQTIDPITTTLQNDAKANNIPVVPVTETMPPNDTYQTWMLNQLNTLEQALGQ
jgi:zinc/manganese transport system substrate-binding protein